MPWRRSSRKSEKRNSSNGNDCGASPASPVAAEPQDKRTRRRGKKSSSSSLKSGEMPPPDCARQSVVLESPTTPSAAPTAPVVEQGDSSLAGEGPGVEPSSGSVEGELFSDDPVKMQAKAGQPEDEVKKKPSHQHNPGSELRFIEEELRKREAELGHAPTNKTVFGRLSSLLDAYEERYQKHVTDTTLRAKSHEVARKSMEGAHRTALSKFRERLESQEKEASEEVTKLKADGQAAEEKWQDEKENMRAEHTLEVKQLNEKLRQMKTVEEIHKQNEERLKSECASKLEKVENEALQMSAQLKEQGERYNTLNCMHQQLLSGSKELERSKANLDEEVSQKEQLLSDLKAKNSSLEEQVTQLQAKCTEHEQDVSTAAGSTSNSKLHGLEKMVKSYETKVAMLEQRLQEEIRARAASEEQLKLVNEAPKEQEKVHDLEAELNKREAEVDELSLQLQKTTEQLHEQEAKREESQRKMEALEKTMRAEASRAKSEEYLEKYVDGVTKFCEELTDWKRKSEEQQKELEKLKKVVANAERMETAYVKTTEKLSEAEAKLGSQVPETVAPKSDHGSEKEVPVASSAVGGHTSSPVDSSRAVKKLKREVNDLREKLAVRDEELRELKSTKGDNPLALTPLSPTESMAADASEVSALKLALRQKERELKNLRTQVSSMEQDLKEREYLKKTSDSLLSEIAKLGHDRRALENYTKHQSKQVLTLKTELEAKAKEVPEFFEDEVKKWRTISEVAYQEVESLKTCVETLTKERDESRSELAAAVTRK
jgi:hypothetical protein